MLCCTTRCSPPPRTWYQLGVHEISWWMRCYYWSWKHFCNVPGTCDSQYVHVFSTCTSSRTAITTIGSWSSVLTPFSMSDLPIRCDCLLSTFVLIIYCSVWQWNLYQFVYASLSHIYSFILSQELHMNSLFVIYCSSNLPTLNYCCGCDSTYKMLTPLRQVRKGDAV